MDMPAAIAAVIDKRNLSQDEMESVMRSIMTGNATQSQIGGFLVGLRMKGETVDEITAAARVMRELAAHVKVNGQHLVDTCGTGGDGARTFNISTAVAFVAAAAGAKVAKHGNRSISSKSGSADVLEAAGVNLDLAPEQVAQCIEQVGVGFMFAPKHHAAMRHAIGPRKEMGVRTIFNLLGPLTNPAGAPNQVLGVFSNMWLEPLAKVLGQLGSHHVLVVHAEDGMDEISIAAATHISELKDGNVTSYTITPDQFGFERGKASALVVDNAQQSLAVIMQVFNNEPGPARDIVLLNAGAAIYASGLAENLQSGILRAEQALGDGSAAHKLQALVDISQQLAN